MKQKQTGYMVVEGDIVEALTSKVENLLEQGWKATGGVERIQGMYTQALVLETAVPVKDYTIIDEEDPNKFVKEINLLIQNGWELMGGPSTSHYVGVQHNEDYHGTRFVQAMVKY